MDFNVLAFQIVVGNGCGHREVCTFLGDALLPALKQETTEIECVGSKSSNGSSSGSSGSSSSGKGGGQGEKVQFTVTSEAGASVYSVSKPAQNEMPDLDASLRGAVSIARRLQDPLAELIKIEPSALGYDIKKYHIVYCY